MMRAASGRSSDEAAVKNIQPSGAFGAWPPSSATEAADEAAASRGGERVLVA
jgi:hypothetical protein